MSFKRKIKKLLSGILAFAVAAGLFAPLTRLSPLAQTSQPFQTSRSSQSSRISRRSAPAPLFPSIGGISFGAYAGKGSISAGEEDCAYICYELGILRGEGDGVTDEYLEKETERVQAAYLTLRLVGKESEAENYSTADNFSDVGSIYDGGQRRTAYLKAHSREYGWEGDGTNKLMPHQNVTAQQFYKVLLTVLGYEANVDYPYEDTLEFAEDETGMFECADIGGSLINDYVATMMVEALLSYMKDETYTLAEYLAEEGVIDYDTAVELGVISRNDILEPVDPAATPEPSATPTPTPALSLIDTSVTAVNFAEIDIVFNQEINKDSIDKNYIKIDNGPLNPTDYVYVTGENNRTLRIYREQGFVTQQGQRRTVSISRIKSTNGAYEMTPISAREVVFYDNQTPELQEVMAIGLRRVKLVFSEPLRTADSAVKNYATYKFNGTVMYASDGAIANGREVYLNFSTPLNVGNNTLTIDRNRLYDLASFPILDVIDLSFLATEDTEAPFVVNVDAWREKVVVTFSEEVRDTVSLSWLDGTNRRKSTSQLKDNYNRNQITFSFAEAQYLPISSVEIVVEAITDMNSVPGTEYRTSVVPKFDTDRPTVVSVESSATNEIIVGFSKPVKLDTSNNNRFLLRNSSNVTITLNVQAYTPTGASSTDPRYIRLAGNIPAGSYTLTVANVEDLTAQANKSAESVHNVNVQDKTPPQVLSVSANIAESKVVFVFNKQIDWTSATDPLNYEFFSPGRGHVTVPSGTTAFLEGDGRTVVLTFPAGGWVVGGNTVVPNAFTLYVATNNADELRVLNVMDTMGNRMQPTLADVPGTNETAAKLTASAYAVTTQRLMLRFEQSGALPVNAASQDFIVRAGNQNIPFRAMGYNSINTSLRELYIDLDGSDLNPDGTYGTARQQVTIQMVLPNQVSATKTALGTPLEILNGAIVTVTDSIRPDMLESYRGARTASASRYLSNITLPALTRDQILVVFNELVQFPNVTSAAQLVSYFDVKLESQPGASISPTLYTVEAYNNQSVVTNQSVVDTRMVIITMTSPVNEAVNVALRANSVWDGNRDVSGLNVMNNAFETGFLAAAV